MTRTATFTILAHLTGRTVDTGLSAEAVTAYLSNQIDTTRYTVVYEHDDTAQDSGYFWMERVSEQSVYADAPEAVSALAFDGGDTITSVIHPDDDYAFRVSDGVDFHDFDNPHAAFLCLIHMPEADRARFRVHTPQSNKWDALNGDQWVFAYNQFRDYLTFDDSIFYAVYAQRPDGNYGQTTAAFASTLIWAVNEFLVSADAPRSCVVIEAETNERWSGDDWLIEFGGNVSDLAFDGGERIESAPEPVHHIARPHTDADDILTIWSAEKHAEMAAIADDFERVRTGTMTLDEANRRSAARMAGRRAQKAAQS